MLNPNNIFANGKYFCTLKSYDGPNDSSSNIDRNKATFRLNLKISKQRFLSYFAQSAIPKRAIKGGTITLQSYHNDFSRENEILPHPVYAWLSWACVINPTITTFEQMLKDGFFDDAYNHALSLVKKSL